MSLFKKTSKNRPGETKATKGKTNKNKKRKEKRNEDILLTTNCKKKNNQGENLLKILVTVNSKKLSVA